MSSLTAAVQQAESPVGQWMRATFPHLGPLRQGVREAAGGLMVAPSTAVALGTQGAAIDWWLRLLIDRRVSLELPMRGLWDRGAGFDGAGRELLDVLCPRRPTILEPAVHASETDEWWARVCYALALLVERFRNPVITGSRLFTLSRGSTAADLLALANDDEVADLIAMRDLALSHLLPRLTAGTVHTGPTFDGSAYLGADADLVADGVLIDFKAGCGGKPRRDGTRSPALASTDVYQLLGYALMDFSDRYALHTVGVYAVRFGYLAQWPLTELIRQATGRTDLGLLALRQQFGDLLAASDAAGAGAHRRR
ncbi:hypothetical protein OHA72_06420 [Dactylosporangium sp. NBC_01737]|uniref:hypothetical protein n=1 Tax=Dactylosporangium sp. NBC_01737 TaxID=2975959 RepID=UPI002E11E116|nr:hypothetical protein OHA72_06420 [Dactylosporangium sp. NBC_01737]